MRQNIPGPQGILERVSIHALLAECDPCPPGCHPDRHGFNPRTPCGVRRFGALSIFFNALFQSTHSLRSATFGKPDWVHRPRFQSTHSLRSATTTLHNAKAETSVSIHALLAECDRGFCSRGMNFCGFNPRTPCGVRPNPCKDHPVLLLFQSTHSLRSATDLRRDLADMRRVSIHALLAECDLSVRSPLFFSDSFNPRTPCGVRPSLLPEINRAVVFQSTHSLRSATDTFPANLYLHSVSIHALLAECDRCFFISLCPC